MSFLVTDNNNNSDGDYGQNCLLIICPSCDVVLRRCMFLFHCENECIYEDIKCVNECFGCKAVLPRQSMKSHLEEHCLFNMNIDLCRYTIKDPCGCSRSYNKDMSSIPSHCLNHCLGCVNSNCNDEVCLVVNCENKCGFRMHTCKVREHIAEICSLTTVECINKWCGCMLTMCRSQRGIHLTVCPCSIITCTVEWRRNVSGCKVYQRYMDDGGGEGSQLMTEWLFARNDRTLDSSFSEAMSLRDELNLCICLIDRIKLKSFNALGYRINVPMRSLSVKSFSVLGRPTINICDSRSCDLSYFNNEIHKLKDYSSKNSSEDSVDSTEECKVRDDIAKDELLYYELKESWKESSWRIENMSKSQTHNPGTITFQCAQSVPRTEYHNHYLQHSDISCQMDDWIEMSCPFASLGCNFTLMRLSPTNSRLVYHPLSNFYGIRYTIPKETKSCFIGRSLFSLLQLPLEILILICSFLDGCSLQHFASTHPRMLEAVKMLRYGYCIYLDWQRTENCNWRSHAVSFLPSTRGSKDAVKKLVFTRNCVGAMTVHMSQCVYRGEVSLNHNTPPYCLHTLPIGSNDNILPEFLRSTCHGQ